MYIAHVQSCLCVLYMHVCMSVAVEASGGRVAAVEMSGGRMVAVDGSRGRVVAVEMGGARVVSGVFFSRYSYTASRLIVENFLDTN